MYNKRLYHIQNKLEIRLYLEYHFMAVLKETASPHDIIFQKYFCKCLRYYKNNNIKIS